MDDVVGDSGVSGAVAGGAAAVSTLLSPAIATSILREGLGMSEYTQRFAENGIDVLVLPHLTEQDPQGQSHPAILSIAAPRVHDPNF